MIGFPCCEDRLVARLAKSLAALAIVSSMALAEAPAGAEGAPSAARQAELRNLLIQDCGSCHGLTLGGGLGPPLHARALSGKPPEYLTAAILYGRPGTAMPPWHPFLSANEAAWLAHLLKQQPQ